jgi:hypothetical protein
MDDTTNTLELITLQGGVIEIEYPDSIMDEILEGFNESRQRRDWWDVGNWRDAKAMYKGHRLNYIDMTQIIGIGD